MDIYKDTQKICVAVFDKVGCVSYTYDIDENNNLGTKGIYRYNDDNIYIEHLTYDIKGALTQTRKYDYDKHGNFNSITGYGPDGKFSYMNCYEYQSFDAKGNWTKSTGELNYGNKIITSCADRQIIYFP
jgi:hypothetical protein